MIPMISAGERISCARFADQVQQIARGRGLEDQDALPLTLKGRHDGFDRREPFDVEAGWGAGEQDTNAFELETPHTAGIGAPDRPQAGPEFRFECGKKILRENLIRTPAPFA
jgi:hypothetical protein